MKRNHKAITLIELLVSIIIVSMVVGGVFTADIALRRMSDTLGTDVQLQMQTMALAETIRSDVKKVHGDLTAGNSGMMVDVGTKSFCFRYDAEVSGQYTPGNYADDKWSCYTKLGTEMHRCDAQDHADACTDSDPQVGTIVSDYFNLMAIPSLEMVADQATGAYYFEMTLINRLDPAAGTAHNGNTLTSGTEENPQVVMTIHESPMGF